MLHRFTAFKKNLRLIAFLFVIINGGCRQEQGTQSEEEAAYLADYEAPSDYWGFMDRNGNLAIEARYDDAGSFAEGLAAINKNGKWGYINREGKTIIEPVYKSAWAFHEGFARVLPFDGPDQFIDRNGQAMPSENWSAADDFAEGRARVKVGNTYGYIDTAGQLIIQPIYTRGWNFENGLTIIEYQEKLGVIDLNGENILAPEFDKIKKVANGNILLAAINNTAIAFDKSGNELIKIENSKMIDSNGDVVSVREGDKMYLVEITNPDQRSGEYTNIIYLEENLWAGKLDSGYVIMNSDGQRLTSNYYHQVNKFSDGFAAYSKDDYWGYLDTSGKEMTGEVFGLAWDYKEGYARAAFKEGIAFIDKNQKLAFYPPPGSLDMRDFSEGLAAVMLD